jgi:hypothetical protein
VPWISARKVIRKETAPTNDADPAGEDSGSDCQESGSGKHHGEAHRGGEVWPRRG